VFNYSIRRTVVCYAVAYYAKLYGQYTLLTAIANIVRHLQVASSEFFTFNASRLQQFIEHIV